jgi:hypothetical protein
MKACPAMTVLAPTSVFRPRIGRSPAQVTDFWNPTAWPDNVEMLANRNRERPSGVIRSEASHALPQILRSAWRQLTRSGGRLPGRESTP